MVTVTLCTFSSFKSHPFDIVKRVKYSLTRVNIPLNYIHVFVAGCLIHRLPIFENLNITCTYLNQCFVLHTLPLYHTIY